jgi:SAM-dependent methyltransferase
VVDAVEFDGSSVVVSERPEYDDPQRYVELAAFDGEFRDLWHDVPFLRLIRARWRLDAATRVLDVGCGAGHWGRTVLRELAPGAHLTGVDREAHFLELARAEASRAGLPAEYVQGRAEALPLPDASFDLVTCQTLLIHVHEVELAIAEMIRVLRPGGVLVLCEPDNRAGNLALLGGEPRVSDDDVLAIVELVLAYERGKIALREGDSSVGSRLPGLLAAAGLHDVQAFANPNCISLWPPYEEPRMRTCLEQERTWFEQGVSPLLGSRHDVHRMVIAGGGDQAFDRGWAALMRFTERRLSAVDTGAHHAAGGFVFYYVAGRKPSSSQRVE